MLPDRPSAALREYAWRALTALHPTNWKALNSKQSSSPHCCCHLTPHTCHMSHMIHWVPFCDTIFHHTLHWVSFRDAIFFHTLHWLRKRYYATRSSLCCVKGICMAGFNSGNCLALNSKQSTLPQCCCHLTPHTCHLSHMLH